MLFSSSSQIILTFLVLSIGHVHGDDPRTDTCLVSLERIHRNIPLSCALPLLCVSRLVWSVVPNYNITRTPSIFLTHIAPLHRSIRLSSITLKVDSTRKTGSPGVMDKIFSGIASAAKSNVRPATTGAAAAASTILPSLGASGAIYSTVVVSTLAFPDTEVSLVFPPTPSFLTQYGVGGMALLDCRGILRGWRYGHPPSGFLMDVLY